MEKKDKLTAHFTYGELWTHDGTPLPTRYIHKYLHTLDFLERLRGFMNFVIFQKTGKWLDKGIAITSGYRHLSYNRMVGSEDTSMHTDPNPESKNLGPCATDVRPSGADPYEYFTYDDFHQMAELVDKSFPDRPYRIGRYNKSKFVHIDCGYGYGGLRWKRN